MFKWFWTILSLGAPVFTLIHLSSAILPPYIGGDLRHEILS